MIKQINYNFKKNIIGVVSILILIQPIIDLIIGLSNNFDFYPNIASIIRVFVLFVLLYYFIFLNRSKYKNTILIFLSFILLYLIFYWFNSSFVFIDMVSTIKVFYFPIILLILISIFEEEKKFIDKKYFVYTLLIYSTIILLGYISNTAFASYEVAKQGTVGYFHAANEIGAIFSILLPFAFMYLLSNQNIKSFIYLTIIVLAIIIMGTKTPFIALIICIIYYLIKKIKEIDMKKAIIFSFLFVLITPILIVQTPIYKNIVIHAKYLNIDSIEDFAKTPTFIDQFLLGSRIKFSEKNSNLYLEESLDDKLFGMEYKNTSKLTEMDFTDILYMQGLIGFILYCSVLVYSIFYSKKINKDYILPLVLSFLIALFVGHTITAPAVSIFVALIICGLKKEVSK